MFSDDDFENIGKLSGATKERQTDKIGRFGLGFNAVYNLTDVPSFVSRHSVVIFDPQTTHLGRSIKNKSKPGIRIDLRKHRKKLRRIANQFQPYNDVFGCDLTPDSQAEAFDATLFRLPLRTRAQAKTSEICAKHYDDAEMCALLRMLASNADALLLFAQNVTRIGVYHLHRDARSPRDMRAMFVIDKKPVEIVRELLPKVEVPLPAHRLSDDMKKMVQQSSVLRAGAQVLRKVKLGHNISRLDVPDSSQIVELEQVVHNVMTDKCALPTSHVTRTWLVCSYMARAEALHMAAQEHSLSPCAGVAVPLVKTSRSDRFTPVPLTHAGRPAGALFAYMPLPVASGLPVHVNGAFALSSSRRQLCERNDDDKFDIRATWNETLLRDATCGAYLRLLQDLTSVAPAQEFGFAQLWPDASSAESFVKPFVDAFYRRVATHKPPPSLTLFSDATSWKAIDDVIALSEELATSQVAGVALQVAQQCWKSRGKLFVYLPRHVRAGFVAAGLERDVSARSLSTAQFFSDVFLPNVERVRPSERDSLVQFALLHSSSELRALLADVRCVPVAPRAAQLRSPGELIDPTSALAVLFSDPDQRFPHSAFREKIILDRLRALGMRTERVDWADLVASVRRLESDSFDEARAKVATIVTQIERNIRATDSSSHDADKHVQQLRGLRFLLPMRRPDYFPLSWEGDALGEHSLLSPDELYHPSYKDVVCLVEPVLDTASLPGDCTAAIDSLSMASREPNVDTVLEQLLVLSGADTSSLSDTRIFKDVHRICAAVYELLQFRIGQSDVTRDTIMTRLRDKPVIFCHARFLRADQLAFDFAHSCAPYLFSVPDTMRKSFEQLLRALGVRNSFETSDYVTALQRMHDKRGDVSLSRDDVKLALQLVNLLSDAMTDANLTAAQVTSQYGDIYVPDASGKLSLAHALCFNEPDCAWVGSGSRSSAVPFSHPLLAFAVAKRLGVSTQRRDMLTRHSSGIGFGQKERLTNRIRGLLAAYPCDKEILKELLQNADDARASNIVFINDPRTHRSHRIFDDSWAPLQGPALCVYNDRPFSARDIEAIQQLGEGSKSLDPNKTGQYGVGFNCVYHLTDAPSFLTCGSDVGETLCVFDPHAKYVPGATSDEPGRRFDDVTHVRRVFSDVFPCYLENLFPIKDATMFRFPLRTPAMAEQSLLSERSRTSHDVSRLFERFRSEMLDALLFVNHVRSVTLCDVDVKTGRKTNVYTVAAHLSQAHAQLRDEFAAHVTSVGEQVRAGTMPVRDVPLKEVTYSMKLSDNRGHSEEWLVQQRIGFGAHAQMTSSLSDAFRRKELSLLPRGGVAVQLDKSDASDWSASSRGSRLFCFLPLPLRTQLPVNINGHFALDHEARRNLWTDSDRSAKSEWNELLFEHVIAPSYVTLLKHARAHLGLTAEGGGWSALDRSDVIGSTVERFDQLFPRFAGSESYLQPLVRGELFSLIYMYLFINEYSSV